MFTTRRNALFGFFAAVVATAFAWSLSAATPNFGQPQIGTSPKKVAIFTGQFVNFGEVKYTGSIDVNPTLERIRAGIKDTSNNNDGGVFNNYEKRLPIRASGYYREFVVRPPAGVNINPPGPGRLVLGSAGEVYFTGDHYASFNTVWAARLGPVRR